METITEIRYKNLLRLIEEHKTITSLALRLGKSHAQISQLKNRSENSTGRGKSRTIGDNLAREIEEKLKLPRGWMDVSHDPNTREIDIKQGMVPVVSWVRAGAFDECIDIYQPGFAEEWLPCPVNHSRGTFALTVSGLSMYNPNGNPSFEDGEVIFVDPMVAPDNKSFVIVRKEGDKEATFKQIIIESGRRYLKPLNPDWPDKIIEVTEESTICGVVIGKWTPFK